MELGQINFRRTELLVSFVVPYRSVVKELVLIGTC